MPCVGGRDRRDRDEQPLVQEGEVAAREGQLLDLLDEVVVLGVEDVVDGGQADVLVAASVARDVVGVEQLVVVGSAGRGLTRPVVEPSAFA